jgi:hypothetical protein
MGPEALKAVLEANNTLMLGVMGGLREDLAETIGELVSARHAREEENGGT